MTNLDRERRRSFRVPVPATAFLWRQGRFAGGYPVADISIGGCSIAEGPFCDLGQRYDLTLRVSDTIGDDGQLHCPAKVVRRHGGRVGLRFIDTDDLEDRIHDLVLRCLEQGAGSCGQVLLVHPRPEQMMPVMRQLEALGHRVHLACTPLQTVWILENSAEQIHTAIVARHLSRADGRDIVRFLSERYPRIRRVLLADDDDSRELESAGRAHMVLDGLFDPETLRRVVPEPVTPVPLTA